MNNVMKLKISLVKTALSLLVPACFVIAQAAPPKVISDSGNILVVLLNHGDSLFPKLTEVINTYGIKSGLILADMGRLRNFTLSFYDVSIRQTVSKRYSGPYNLAVTQGIIGHTTGDSLSMDIVALCDSVNTDLHASDVTSRSIGGHLSGGIVDTQNVIIIKRLDTIRFVRDYHPENGTWDLDIDLATPATSLPKNYGSAGVRLLRDYKKALVGANSDAPVFDVAGRRINRLRNGRLEKAAAGMYVVPQRAGRTGTIIKK
jgi:predicted DNA-binding protein with PD1-like motif